MWFHFQLNDVFFAMLDGKEFDAGEKFPYLKEYYVTQMVSLGEELTTRYVFASESNYLAFLLIHFIMAKPRLQQLSDRPDRKMYLNGKETEKE